VRESGEGILGLLLESILIGINDGDLVNTEEMLDTCPPSYSRIHPDADSCEEKSMGRRKNGNLMDWAL
jgi:hypothetical protein